MANPLSDYDAIIIGAGHNGLTNAAYLARAGKKVVVLERREIVGGAAVTEAGQGPLYEALAEVCGALSYMIVQDAEGGWLAPAVITRVAERLGLPVYIENDANLCERFDQQYSGHDRMVRKMSPEEGLVDCHILEPYHVARTIGFDNSIDQQERKAVRQDF